MVCLNPVPSRTSTVQKQSVGLGVLLSFSSFRVLSWSFEVASGAGHNLSVVVERLLYITGYGF